MIDFSKRTIVVLGQKVELNTVDGLPIADISIDMDRVAAQMAWWGAVWAAAERQKIEVAGKYRKWKSIALLEAKARGEKDAEWKIRAHVEGSEGFLAFQDEIALAEEAVVLSKNVFDAFSKKANMLQSRGAIQRGTIERQGLNTPAKPRSAPSTPPPVGGDPEEPPMFTAEYDVEDLKPPKARPSTEEIVALQKSGKLKRKEK